MFRGGRFFAQGFFFSSVSTLTECHGPESTLRAGSKSIRPGGVRDGGTQRCNAWRNGEADQN